MTEKSQSSLINHQRNSNDDYIGRKSQSNGQRIHLSSNDTAEKGVARSVSKYAKLDDLIDDIRDEGQDAAVPEGPELEEEKQRRLSTYRSELTLFWISAALTLPLLVEMLMGYADSPLFTFPRWLQLALATTVQFWIGKRFYLGVWRAIRGESANMDLLVVLGTSVAYGFSCVVIFLGLSDQHVYFGTSAAIITLSLMGRLLEVRAKNKTMAEIEALARLQPRMARVEVAGVATDVPAEQVKVGDRVLIRPGEPAPIGGLVLEGRSNVDESMLTGEGRPVQKRPGDQVYAGTMNLHGHLAIQAIRIGRETVLAQIIRLVNRAQGSKVSIQRLPDKISGVFVPIIITVSLITFFVWWELAGNFTQALISAVTVLVVACPGALILAAPTAAIVGIGQGARNGIFIRTAVALERAEKIQVMVLDKTGALTEGKPSVTDIVPIAGRNPYDVLYLAAALAEVAAHPLSGAIVERAKAEGITPRKINQFIDDPGEGIEAQIEDKLRPGAMNSAWLGSPTYLRSRGIVVEKQRVKHFTGAGKTVIGVADRGGVVGYLAIADQVRPTSPTAVSRLKEMGFEILMLSEDDLVTTKAIATAVGISNHRAEVSPGEKADIVRGLRAEGKIVGMVGTGIDDARALMAADVSVAVGGGAKVPMDMVDITLMKGDLASLVDAIALSRATLKKIRQNLFFAFMFNVAGILIASFGLLNPVIACSAMIMGSISVIGNALLLKGWKPTSL